MASARRFRWASLPILVPPAEPAWPVRGSHHMKPAAVSLLIVILLLAPGPALGKVPWSSVEVEPATPVAGEPLTVVVRFWDDAAHTRPSTWSPGSDHEVSLEFEGAAGRVPLTLTQIGDATLRADVTLSEGTWRLVAVQDFAEASGPTDVELATVTVAAPRTTAPIGAAVIGVALVTAGVIWRGRRSSVPKAPG